MAIADLVGGWLAGDVEEGDLVAALRSGGFTNADAVALTRLLEATGEHLDLSSLGPLTVDKHSTGGVADSTTLFVAPLLAAAGAVVVKLSGRGLGHTGGTIDKLESIPGVRTDLEPSELVAIARRTGCVVASQSARLVPGDRALYALRHETGTVADPALIASSVMAKKLAAGARTIVLDVKAGQGAFLHDVADARALARLCVRIGTEAGRRCVALVTPMDQPLGRAIGNALEVAEAVELLAEPPAGRLAALALELAAEGLALARGETVAAARADIEQQWIKGRALERLRALVTAQGGAGDVCDDPHRVLPRAPAIVEVATERAGWVAAVPARAVGELAGELGAARRGRSGAVDPAVGVRLAVEVGSRVEAGQRVGVVHARDHQAGAHAAARLAGLVRISAEPVPAPPSVIDRVA